METSDDFKVAFNTTGCLNTMSTYFHQVAGNDETSFIVDAATFEKEEKYLNPQVRLWTEASLKLRRPWIGAFWLGGAYSEIFRFRGSQDALNAHIEPWQWYRLIAVVLFFLWVFIAYVGVQNLRIKERRK